MQQLQLQKGHIVHLNSGSPDLKVVAVEGKDITVEWFNEEDVLEQITLPEGCFKPSLRKADTSDFV